MTWNHRVVRFEDDEMGEYFEIKEVFYKEDGSVSGYSDACILSDTFDGINEQLDMFKRATFKPIIDEAEFFVPTAAS